MSSASYTSQDIALSFTDKFASVVQYSPRGPGNSGFTSCRSPVVSVSTAYQQMCLSLVSRLLNIRLFTGIYHIGVAQST